MNQHHDYLDKDTPNEIKELLQTEGIHRKVLEIRNIKANTELSLKTLRKLKYDNIINLIFLLVGSLLTFILTTYSNNNYENRIDEKVEKLTLENQKLNNDLKVLLSISNNAIEKMNRKLDTLKK